MSQDNVLFYICVACFIELVMNIFKLREDDEAYAAINDELNKVTPFMKELVFDITNK